MRKGKKKGNGVMKEKGECWEAHLTQEERLGEGFGADDAGRCTLKEGKYSESTPIQKERTGDAVGTDEGVSPTVLGSNKENHGNGRSA